MSWILSLHNGRQQLHLPPVSLRLGCYQHSHPYHTLARPCYVLRVMLPPTFTAPLPVTIRTASSCDVHGCCGMFRSCALAIMRHADKRLPMLWNHVSIMFYLFLSFLFIFGAHLVIFVVTFLDLLLGSIFDSLVLYLVLWICNVVLLCSMCFRYMEGKL